MLLILMIGLYCDDGLRKMCGQPAVKTRDRGCWAPMDASVARDVTSESGNGRRFEFSSQRATLSHHCTRVMAIRRIPSRHSPTPSIRLPQFA
jgi:hypothetical protein